MASILTLFPAALQYNTQHPLHTSPALPLAPVQGSIGSLSMACGDESMCLGSAFSTCLYLAHPDSVELMAAVA